MEDTVPDSGSDPPFFPLRMIKMEPLDEDDHVHSTTQDDDAVKIEREEFKHVRTFTVKEEIMDDDEEEKTEPMVADLANVKQEQEGEENYCFCGAKSLVTDFMIACEKCDIWFHGQCVEIDTEMSFHIKKFYCNTCCIRWKCATTYKKSFAVFMDRREKQQIQAEARERKKAAKDAKQAKKLAKNMKKIKIEIKTEVKDEIDHDRAPRCLNCINCAVVVDCEQCYYCTSNTGRCIRVECLSLITAEIEQNQRAAEEPTPTVSPKGSARRKPQRKRKSGEESDDDELFFSESTATRKMIKKELSYKEEQQLDDLLFDEEGNLVEKKKRGRRKGWRKAIDGKKDEGEEGEETTSPKVDRRRRKKKDDPPTPKKGGRIFRAGRDAEFLRQNGPENADFERPEYNVTLTERLVEATTSYAIHREHNELITEPKTIEKCKNEGCESGRRAGGNYCSDECGMMMAQTALGIAGILARPLPVPKKKRRVESNKKALFQKQNEKMEERRLDLIAAAQEQDYQLRKAKAEEMKEEFVEVKEDEDLIQASFRQLQKDVAKIQRAEQAEQRRIEDEEIAEAEREKAKADAEYKALTNYLPISAQAALSNGLDMLMSQPVVRPVPVHPMPGLFPPQGYFNPFFAQFNTPINDNGLLPSLPIPILASLTQAYLDHNDYSQVPVVPWQQLILQYPQLFNAQMFVNPALQPPQPILPAPIQPPQTILAAPVQPPTTIAPAPIQPSQTILPTPTQPAKTIPPKPTQRPKTIRKPKTPKTVRTPQPNQNNPSPTNTSTPSTASGGSPVSSSQPVAPVQFVAPERPRTPFLFPMTPEDHAAMIREIATFMASVGNRVIIPK